MGIQCGYSCIGCRLYRLQLYRLQAVSARSCIGYRLYRLQAVSATGYIGYRLSATFGNKKTATNKLQWGLVRNLLIQFGTPLKLFRVITVVPMKLIMKSYYVHFKHSSLLEYDAVCIGIWSPTFRSTLLSVQLVHSRSSSVRQCTLIVSQRFKF
jgi:hypothetical protein